MNFYKSIAASIALYGVYSAASADGYIIDKIYHPYVQPGEKEVELRGLLVDDSNNLIDGRGKYRIGYGQSVTDSLFLEVYLIGEKKQGNSLTSEAVELEAIWQMTEQGEFWADWGMLFELERETTNNIWELSSAILMEKEWGNWLGAANLYGIYEWGGGINDGFEVALGLQTKYRYSRAFEPAIEFYAGRNTLGAGPVFMGNVKTGAGTSVSWEAGVVFGLDDITPERTIKGLLEFEF